MTEFFRHEALSNKGVDRTRKELLEIPSGWPRLTYWSLIFVACASLALLVFGSISEYAEGPALIRRVGRAEITASRSGVVSMVSVALGDDVSAGAVIASYASGVEAAELEARKQAFRLQLLQVLRDPLDRDGQQQLAVSKVEMELAEARMELQLIRATTSGVLRSLRVRSGQGIGAGQVIAIVEPSVTRIVVEALLPGYHRPELREGQTMLLDIVGQPIAQLAIIDLIDDSVIGPSEARRIIGQDLADGFSISGPIVLVRGTLLSTGRGEKLEEVLYDGMPAFSRVRLRRTSILAAWLER